MNARGLQEKTKRGRLLQAMAGKRAQSTEALPRERWEAAGCSSRPAGEKGAAGEGQVLRSLGARWGLM